MKNKNLKIKFDNNKPFYDFEGLSSNDYRLFIINGIMDDGKTFGAKENMLFRFLEFGERSIWIMNSKVILEEELLKFKVANEEVNLEWKNVTITTSSNSGITTAKYNGEVMCYFVAISSITKVARDERIKNIYYDEFNYLDTRTYKLQINKFQLLLSRNMRVNKIYLIGNATSLNIPLLYHFNIWELPKEKEFFEFDVGEMKGLFHIFSRTQKEIEEKYEDSISYQIMKKTGFANHAFKNEYIRDNLAKIDKEYLKKNKDLKLTEVFQISPDLYVDFYSNGYFNKFYMNLSKNVEREEYCISRDYMKDGIKYAPQIAERLGYYFQKDLIWYENVTIKQYFYDVVKPYLRDYI